MTNEQKNTDYQTPTEKLESVIAKLIISSNYWGFVFGKIRRRPNRSLPSIMGVAPSQKKKGVIELLYHPVLVEKTSEKSLCKVIEHEGLHLLNQHISRQLRLISTEENKALKFAKSRIWNIASDCCANRQAQLPDKLEVCGEEVGLCHAEKYGLPNDRTAESYFHTLYRKSDLQCPVCGSSMKNEDQQSGKSDQESKSGNGDQEQNKQESSQEKDSQNDSGSGGENQEQGNKCPFCGKEHNQQGQGDQSSIDDHQNWNVPDGEEEEYAREIENRVKKIAKQAKKEHQTRGTMPAYLQELLDELLGPPKIPYYQMIRKLVVGSRLAKSRIAYNRANKKKAHLYFSDDNENEILPFPGKLKDKTFNIGIMIDTSASQGPDDIAEALSGIKDIIENDRNCFVTVVECDTQVNKEYEIQSVNDIDFEISGRGGTILKPGIERMAELKSDVSLLFTDGMCDNINEMPKDSLPKKRMIWVISPNGTEQMVNKTGVTVYIQRNDQDD